jgi:hypothetical protein
MTLKQTSTNNILTNIESMVELYTPKFLSVPYFAIMDVKEFGTSTNSNLSTLSQLLNILKTNNSTVVTSEELNYRIGDTMYKNLSKNKNINHHSVESELNTDIIMPRDYAKRKGCETDTQKLKDMKATIHPTNNLITNAEVFISSDIFSKYITFPIKSRKITLLLLSQYMDKHINLLEINIKKVALELEVSNTQLLNALHSLVSERMMIPIDNPTTLRMNARHTYRFLVDPAVAIHKPSNYAVINYTYTFMGKVAFNHHDTISLGVVKEHMTQGVYMVKALKKLHRLDSELERLQYHIKAVEKLGIEVPKPNGMTKNKKTVIRKAFDLRTLDK